MYCYGPHFTNDEVQKGLKHRPQAEKAGLKLHNMLAPEPAFFTTPLGDLAKRRKSTLFPKLAEPPWVSVFPSKVWAHGDTL